MKSCRAGRARTAPIVPWPAVQVKTWKMAEAEPPGMLSTKPIFFPSKERIGEVVILPPVDGGDVIGKQHVRSRARTKPGAGGVDIEIVEGDKIGNAAPVTSVLQSEHDVVIGAIGRSVRHQRKTWPET